MAFYTYTGNVDTSEKTSRIVLRGGGLVIEKNQYADLTTQEYNSLKDRYTLVPGQQASASQASTQAGLDTLLSPLAITQLLAKINNGIGPLALRPAANAVPKGTQYFASDEGVVYVSDGDTAWAAIPYAGGLEIAYTEKTDTAFAPAPSAVTDITNLSAITFDVPVGHVALVEIFCGWTSAAAVGASGSIFITDGSSTITGAGVTATCNAASAQRLGPAIARERISTPGSYTRKGRASSTTGTVTFQAGTGINGIPPLTLRARLER